ncbi:MAG: hypothetical protein LUQ55_01900 [Methanomassiliicoccales archaeon]|nr:hypothetical protein [Methanomassiliicoccales archaeon]
MVVLAIGLVFYFAFSATYGDGLERTMEDAGVEEHEASYTGPFSYGDDYLTALATGLIGAGITLIAVYGFLKISRKRRNAEERR